MQDLKKEQDGRQKNLVVLFSSLIYERTDKYVIIKRKKYIRLEMMKCILKSFIVVKKITKMF